MTWFLSILLYIGIVVFLETLFRILRPRPKTVSYLVWQDAAGQWWAAKSVDGKMGRWIGPYNTRVQANCSGIPRAKAEST